jgi:hypothetical protein
MGLEKTQRLSVVMKPVEDDCKAAMDELEATCLMRGYLKAETH